MKKSFFPIVCAAFFIALLITKIHQTADDLYRATSQNIEQKLKDYQASVVPPLSASTLMSERRQMAQAIRKRLDQDALLDEHKTRDVNYLVRIYTQMPPQDAAKIIENMEASQIIEFLSMMDADTAANILSRMDSVKAAELTQKILDMSSF